MFNITPHRGGLTSNCICTALASNILLNVVVSLHLVSLQDFVFGIAIFLAHLILQNQVPPIVLPLEEIIKACHNYQCFLLLANRSTNWS